MFRGSRPLSAGNRSMKLLRASRFVTARSALCVLILFALGACQQKMANQPRYDPLEASSFFEDGMSARPRLDGTVARGELSTNPFFDTGKVNGQVADGFPMAVTAELVDRGQGRYDIYCAPCHGRVGDGAGMIPARGLRRPTSFHSETLRAATTGHYFDVMTNGFGAMPPYRTMISAQDRWAIVAYIRALQLSQNAAVGDIPAVDLPKLNAPAGAPTATHGGGSH
jgi:cytochrome c5